MKTKRKLVILHDPDPDFSWLQQDFYDPASPNYSPTYRTVRDARRGINAFDPEWYRDPDNHVALMATIYEMTDDDDDWRLIDSVGNIDFLVDGSDWVTGTFYRLTDLPRRSYLREVARDLGLKR